MPIAYCLIPNSPVTFPLLPHLTYETNRKEAAAISDFQRVYQQYSQRLYRFLFALTGSEAQAEELTQEVFYRALLHIDRFQGRCSLFTWLCEIGKNCYLEELRKQKRRRPLEEAPDRPDPAPGPEEHTLSKSQQAALRRAIANLPEDYRDVVILHVYGEIPLKEIAARHGKSESWGKVTFYRAKQRLAQEMEEYR